MQESRNEGRINTNGAASGMPTTPSTARPRGRRNLRRAVARRPSEGLGARPARGGLARDGPGSSGSGGAATRHGKGDSVLEVVNPPPPPPTQRSPRDVGLGRCPRRDRVRLPPRNTHTPLPPGVAPWWIHRYIVPTPYRPAARHKHGSSNTVDPGNTPACRFHDGGAMVAQKTHLRSEKMPDLK